MSIIEDKVESLALEVGRNLGYDVEDLELLGSGRRMIIRISIDREGGVGMDDCAEFSRDFAALMDVEDPIEGRYTIEVGSPGLDRPLKKPAHWKKCIGKLARVELLDPIEGQDVIMGRIEGIDQDDRVTLALEDGSSEQLTLDEIKRARLEVEL